MVSSFAASLLMMVLGLPQETYSTVGRYQKAKQETLPSIIPIDRIVNTVLNKSESHVFYLLDDERQTHPLSVTVIPCSGPVQWSIRHRVHHGIVNDTEILQNSERDDSIYRGNELHTWSKRTAEPGLYLISMTSLQRRTQVQILASKDPEGPYDLSIPQNGNLRAFTMRRHKLLIRWEPSLINPHNITYCLVLSQKREYPKLCEAEREMAENANTSDLRIECVRQKTHLMLTRMDKNRTYFMNLFAVNFRTGLPVPYANLTIIYKAQVQPLMLTDGRPKLANLRKYEGRVSFRFRVTDRTKELHMYVMSCGGSVFAQVMNRRSAVSQKIRVNGYHKFKILRPKRGEYYSLKITAADPDELARIKNVEAFATQYPQTRYPLPELPSEPDLYEYVSLRKCTSVTIGWVPTLNEHPTRYCVYAREILRNAHDRPHRLNPYASIRMRAPDQCGLDGPRIHMPATRLASHDCAFITSNTLTVTTHDIYNLLPGRSYHVQVTVKKQKGRTLSYNLLQVYTKQTCD